MSLLLLLVSLSQAPQAEAPQAEAPQAEAPLLPGRQDDGRVQLPNGWSLRPAGAQVKVGDFPVNVAVHPGGRWLAVLHAGAGTHEVAVVDGPAGTVVSRHTLPQVFYGIAFDGQGERLLVSGGENAVVHVFAFDAATGSLTRTADVPLTAEPAANVVVGGVAALPGGGLAACDTFGHGVWHTPDADTPTRNVWGRADSYPYAVLPLGDRLLVSLWADAQVAVVDPTAAAETLFWPTAAHPTEMAVTPDGNTLFVACANSTKVSVLDATGGQALQTIDCALYPAVPSGNTPNSLCLSPDGELLFVANADANNVAVFNVADARRAKPLGFVPVGWYPTSVRFVPGAGDAAGTLYVANGKGGMPKSNRHGPNPTANADRTLEEYIGRLLDGTLSIVPMPTPAELAVLTRQAYACSPLRREGAVRTAGREQGSPIPAAVGGASPIEHCVYVIKENRTYDQVFGDLPQGNGDASLCIFPRKVTPNHHRLAEQFVLLDNFYVESEVSADGHEWTMGAYATDYVEKVWPLVYRKRRTDKLSYPAEGAFDKIARPAGGYLWDRAAEAGVDYFSFGEWVEGGTPADPGKATVPALVGHIDPLFPTYNLDITDEYRADRFLTVLGEWEERDAMPGLVIVRLPNDHTYGTRVGKPTPTAMVADNDYALGLVVQGLSQSRFWPRTTIFVVEDDAQNGPDHVDAHRTVALCIGPHVKRGVVDSTMYSTSSMLRTMELVLGLQPMSQFDAAATPMYRSFAAEPDATPYEAVEPEVDRTELNAATAWGARLSETFDLSKEDAADDLQLNEVVWRSVRGADRPMPPPVRAAFVLPEVEEED